MAKRTLRLPFSRIRLTEIREKKGLSITALAARCTEQGHAVSRAAIGHIENNLNGPSPELLAALAQALEVPVDDLLDPVAA